MENPTYPIQYHHRSQSHKNDCGIRCNLWIQFTCRKTKKYTGRETNCIPELTKTTEKERVKKWRVVSEAEEGRRVKHTGVDTEKLDISR